jgi:hypothetical protein
MQGEVSMDVKERFLIARAYATICSGNFHELDVLTLLILLRPHAARNSHIREFGDFVAHREKDRGVLQGFLKCFQCALHGNSNVDPASHITNDDIRDSFNEIFRQINLPELNDELANQITICIISLLQSVEIKIQEIQTSCDLKVAISSEQIALRGPGTVLAGHVVDYPILIAKNCLQDAASYPSGFMRPDRVVEAGSVNGIFELEQRSPRV